MKFHELFKNRRKAIGSVRDFAKLSGLDVAYISRLENGAILPPKDKKKLAKLAAALGISDKSVEWQNFMDLAAIAKNELPEDLRNNERVAKILPAFYRTLRQHDLDEDELNKLLMLIREDEDKDEDEDEDEDEE